MDVFCMVPVQIVLRIFVFFPGAGAPLMPCTHAACSRSNCKINGLRDLGLGFRG